MMLSDAPRYIEADGKSKAPDNQERSAEDEANEIVGFYISKLNK